MRDYKPDNFYDSQLGGLSVTNLSTGNPMVDNSPVAFIGPWVETSFYTGGTIMGINNPNNLVIATYTVRTRYGLMYNVDSSDLYRYSIGENVIILKRYDGKSGDFTYLDLSNFRNWVIIPVIFSV